MIRKTLFPLVCASLLLNGCMSFSDHSFNPVREEIYSQIPDLKMRKEFAMSIGPALFNVVDVAAIGSDFDFSAIDHLQLAVYEVAHTADLSSLNVEQSLMARDPGLTWETIVKVREEDEFTWIVVGIDERKASIEAVSVLVMERDELVLINVNGELERMIEFAFEPVKGHKGVFKAS